MKQYLFRGKSVSKGKWVYGSLIHAGSYCCILEDEDKVHPMDYPYLDPDLGVIDGMATPVIPETVGLFTESYDRNNNKIFEGDIVNIYRRHCFSDEQTEEPQCVCIIIDSCCMTENGLGRWRPQDTVVYEVIDNVHDNPELVGIKHVDQYKWAHCLEEN